jgi:hypothetical protein
MSNKTKDNTPAIIAAFETQLAAKAKADLDPGNYPRKAFCRKDAKGKRVIKHSATYEAYARRKRDFKYLFGIVKGDPLDDLAAITKKHGGTIRLVLHLYLHHCLPDYPEKEANLRKLRDNAGSNPVMQRIRAEVEETLDSGKITDHSYATRLLDPKRLIAFTTDWLNTARLYD